MGKFADTLAILRKDVEALTGAENVEQIANIAKSLDTLEAEYKTAEKETQDAKNNLVKYVKTYAFKETSGTDTGIEQPMTLEDAFAKAHEKTLENRKENK